MITRALLVAVVGLMPAGEAASEVNSQPEAQALFEYAQHTESMLLKGVRWKWIRERAKCDSVAKAIEGVYTHNTPVDRHECRFLANDSVYYYESRALQDVRVLPADEGQQIHETTIGSEAHLKTAESRLFLFNLNHNAAINGSMENKENGINPALGPQLLPLHAGSFGLGKISSWLSQLQQMDATISLEEGVRLTGEESKIVRVTKINGNESRWYFDSNDYNLYQRESRYGDILYSQAVVLQSRSIADSTGEFSVPEIVVSCFRSKGDDLWTVDRFITTEIIREAVKPSEMIIPLDNPRVVLYPAGIAVVAKSDRNISAANLDDVVDAAFAELEAREVARSLNVGRRSLEPDAMPGNGRAYYLLLFNAGIILIAVLFFAYRRFRRSD